MPTLIVARHGRSTSNAAGTLAGRTPGIVLDETGESQARALGERLRDVNLAAVVCSPLERCRQTAHLALETAGIDVPVQIDERVVETDYGQWSGRLLKDLAALEEWATVQRTPSRASFPQGEAMIDVRDRVVAAVDDWNHRLPDDAVWLLVSHGDPISGLISASLGMDFDQVQRLVIDPASASVVHFAPTGTGNAPTELGTADAQVAAADHEQPPSDSATKPPVGPLARVATLNSLSGPLQAWLAPVQQTLGGGLGAAGGDAGQAEPSADAGQVEPSADAGQAEPSADAGQAEPNAGAVSTS